MQIAAEGISSSRQFPLSRQTLTGPFLHEMGLFCGQKLPPSTMRPHQVPSAWTGGNIFLPRPQKCPRLWTKATFWHQTSTKSTFCVDRRQYFSSASTKMPPPVDKSHLLAPNIHKKHLLCGREAIFVGKRIWCMIFVCCDIRFNFAI